ncbi:uncharacterized protein KZ484_002791 [Pholidichthys leucotaenia]
MDGVLEAAVVLCVCKVAVSLLFLPSLAAPRSPVSFCCCCLLIFTDFLVTAFLSTLCILEPWLTAPVDVIALRFLLFLSRTYGAALLLTTPLITVETVIRLLRPHTTAESQTASPDGQPCYSGKVNVGEEEGGSVSDEGRRLPHVVGYLCCLSVWVIVALDVRWRWKLEELWATACLQSTNSIVRCLPTLFSPVSITLDSYWSVAFVFLLMLLLSTSTGTQKRQQAPAQAHERGANHVPLLSAPFQPVDPGMSLSAHCVDLEKTESSCAGHAALSRSSVQMSTCHHGDFILIFPRCLSGGRGGQQHKRAKAGTPLTFISEELVHSQYRNQYWCLWGFPCLGERVMIGLVGMLAVSALPLIFGVNILLVRTIETLLELCIKYLLSSVTRRTATSNGETLI